MATPSLPTGVVWHERTFPNSNFLLLQGDHPALIDSGFVAHAQETVALAEKYTDDVAWVVNTHWHSDHVGANHLFQQAGSAIIGSQSDADDLGRRSPDCCVAEYLDQPVPQYIIDRRVDDGERLLLGDFEWDVLAVPGHTPGHLALWNSDQQVLVVGDMLSAYDVGWVNVMLDGTEALDSAIESVGRLRELDARLILPGHGPLIDHPAQAIDKAAERLQRQRNSIAHAADYGAKRILAFALIIRGGMTAAALDDYLLDQDWVSDAAHTAELSTQDFARCLVDTMLGSNALSIQHGIIQATTEAAPADARVFDLPYPRHWLPSGSEKGDHT